MQVIELCTRIAAPLERCFLLSTSIDLHTRSAAQTSERAVAGVTHGMIRGGERVTWRARHFGLMLTHETIISAYEKPTYFQDAMVRGAFKSFVHDHSFEETADGGTLMRDVLRFEAPLRSLGRIAERLVLRAYLTKFLCERNEVIRQVAESKQEWKHFLDGS